MKRSSRFVAIFLAIAMGCAGAAAQSSNAGDRSGSVNPDLNITTDAGYPGEPYYVSGSVLIDAPRERIWALITDCAATERIVPQLKRCEVEVEGDGWDHRRHDVRSGPFRITSVFRSDYDYLQGVRISRVSGDLEVQEGSWTLTSRDDGLIELSYEAWSKPKFWVPRWFIMRSIRKDAPRILANLKDMAEQPPGPDTRFSSAARPAQQTLSQSQETLP
ncbi:MAG: SRPBCC family protein [Pseudomonadota bacterium]